MLFHVSIFSKFDSKAEADESSDSLVKWAVLYTTAVWKLMNQFNQSHVKDQNEFEWLSDIGSEHIEFNFRYHRTKSLMSFIIKLEMKMHLLIFSIWLIVLLFDVFAKKCLERMSKIVMRLKFTKAKATLVLRETITQLNQKEFLKYFASTNYFAR